MLVLVTGGTGLVGSHTVAAVVRARHTVRVLARDVAAVERALAPLAVRSDAVEVLPGDVTDRAAVTRAVRGCDTVVHAASVYSFDTRRRREMGRTNVRGTELVLSAARRFNVGRTIYVSTFGAMLPSPSGLVGPDSPPGTARDPYLASKAAAEVVAREFQARGEPVAITYPPALLGPHDPKLGDQTRRLRNTLRGLLPVWPTGGFPVGDVRDTAELHAALLTTGVHGLDRHLGPGRYLTTRQYVQTVRDVTGRRLPTLFAPARALLPASYLVGLVQQAWPWQIPAEYGACYVCACDARPAGDSAVVGARSRSFDQTLLDTLRWLYGTGRLSERQVGRAVSSPLAVASAPEASARQGPRRRSPDNAPRPTLR